MIGKIDRLLVESDNFGHGENFAKIQLDQPLVKASSIICAKIYKRENNILLARAI